MAEPCATSVCRCTADDGQGHQPQSSHAVTIMATLSGAKICRARLHAGAGGETGLRKLALDERPKSPHLG